MSDKSIFSFGFPLLRKMVSDAFENNPKQALLVSGGILSLVGYGIYRYVLNKRKVSDITSKVIFISGCDSGMGRVIAQHLDSLGIPVFAGCLTKAGADSLQSETSDKLQTVLVDITSSDSIQQALQFIQANILPGTYFWGIVNNAGIQIAADIEFLRMSDFEETMHVNFLGHVNVTATFLPLLKKSKGRIVNIASMATDVLGPAFTAYNASKCALYGFSESLRREKSPWGIQVCVIKPGLFNTQMVQMKNIEATIHRTWENGSEEVKADYGEDYVQRVIDFYQEMYARPPNDFSPLTKTVEHCLFAVSPNYVHSVGIDSKFVGLIAWIPGAMDFGIGRIYKKIYPRVLMK